MYESTCYFICSIYKAFFALLNFILQDNLRSSVNASMLNGCSAFILNYVLRCSIVALVYETDLRKGL